MITIEEFRFRFPEFDDNCAYPDARINIFLKDARQELGEAEDCWVGFYDQAISNLTAHKLTGATATEFGDSNSKLGSITTKTAKGVSVTRAQGNPMSTYDAMYAATSYGTEFMRIRNIVFGGFVKVL